MKKLYPVLVAILVFVFYACSKSGSEGDGGGGGNNGTQTTLSDFSVTIIERNYNFGVITWSAATPSNSADTVKYKVILNGTPLDSNLNVLIDTLSGVLQDNAYSGQVIASTKSGITKTASFTLHARSGKVILSESHPNRLSSLKLFTMLVSSPREWRTNISGDHVGSTGVISGDTIFYASGNGNPNGSVAAFRLSTGNLIWSVTTPYAINRSTNPTYYQGNLYLTTNVGLVSLRSSNGAENWRFQSTLPFSNNPVCNPVISDGKIYVSSLSNSGYLAAINLTTGTALWYYQATGQIAPTPLVVGDLVIINSGINVHAVDKNTGVMRWQRNGIANTFDSPILSENIVIVANESVTLTGLNPLTGATIWSKNYGVPEYHGAIAQGKGKIYFSVENPSTNKSKMIALNSLTGNLVWEYQTFSPSLEKFVFADDAIFAYDDFYGMWQFNANSGRIESGLTGIVDYTFDANSFMVIVGGNNYYNYENGNYKP